MSEVKDNNWLDKIKDLLGDTPKDKKDLITLLDTAAKNNLITKEISFNYSALSRKKVPVFLEKKINFINFPNRPI